MLEPTRKRRTDSAVELRVWIRKDQLSAAKKAVERFTAEDEEVLSLEEAFPNLQPYHAIRGGRAKEGISQKDLANRLGISQSNLSAMENGRRSIGKEMAKRLGHELNLGWKTFL